MGRKRKAPVASTEAPAPEADLAIASGTEENPLGSSKNKSAAIRAFFANARPDATVGDCIAALAEQGIVVTENYVYTVRRGPQKAAAKGGGKKAASGSDDSVIEFLTLAKKLGSERARKLVDLLD